MNALRVSDLTWRRLLLGLAAFAFVQLGLTMVMQALWYGALPGFDNAFTSFSSGETVRADQLGMTYRYRLTVGGGSVAYHAGARTGDVVDLSGLDRSARFRFKSGYWWPGETIALPLDRAGRAQAPLRLTAVRSPGTVDMWIANAGLLWMLAFATAIVARRSADPRARVLSLLLLLYCIGLGFQWQNWITPWPVLDAVLNAFAWVPLLVSWVLIDRYAALFARPISRVRRALTWTTYAACVAAIVVSVLAGANGVLFPGVPLLDALSPGAGGVLAAIALVPLWPALRDARGAERERLAWAVIALVPLYLAEAFYPFIPAQSLATRIDIYAWTMSIAFAPVVLSYSLLSRRLLDVGFAINRAAVFTGVSIIVVGVFILAEWALGELLGAGRTANIAISACLALALGLSMHFIHTRVDHLLDNVFFRKRHGDEQALLAFAHEAAYITDRSVLLERTSRVLEERTAAASAVVALSDRDGRYGEVDENDPALVALRAWHRRVDLATIKSALRGEFAFPMVARGQLRGVLLLGPKRSGESYAPDELSAIDRVAHGVGLALDVLDLRSSDDSVAAALRAVNESIGELKTLLAHSPGVQAL